MNPIMTLLRDRQYKVLDLLVGAGEALDNKLLFFLGSSTAVSSIFGVLGIVLTVRSKEGAAILAALALMLIILQMAIFYLSLRAWTPASFPLPSENDPKVIRTEYLEADLNQAELNTLAGLLRVAIDLKGINTRKATAIKRAGSLFLFQLLIASLIVTLRLLALAGL